MKEIVNPSKTTIRTAMALNDVANELQKAREKYPDPRHLMTALTEHAGKLARAFLDKPMADVYREAVEVACIAIRLATESDPTHDAFRAERSLDTDIHDPR